MSKELIIVGNEDGTHTITLPNPEGVMESWHVPAGVSLETIEEMLQAVLGDMLGGRTITYSGELN